VALAPAGPGSIDVIEIDAASHGGVDDARDLRERAFYAPVSGRFKIYIIDEAHMVTREGFNALLKLVEEPPPHLKFVFATTEPEKVIPTIRSRTHHYPFRLVPPTVLKEHLEQILDSEGVPYEPAVLPVVIRAGAGSVRDALSVLDQLIAGSDEAGLRYDRAISLLGYTDDRLLDEVIEAFSAGDGAAVFRAIDHVVEAGHDPRRFAADLLDRLRDLIILLAVPDAGSTGLIEAPADRLEQMQIQAGKFGPGELTRAAEVISAGLVEMRGATSPRLLLELMCSQVLLPPASAGDGALADRLDRLERRISAGPGPAVASPPVPSPPEPATTGAADGPAPRAAATARPGISAPPAAAVPQGASPAGESAPPAGQAPDTSTLRARWPEVLAAVQRERRVAWIQLSNATVQSFADGVLTLAFSGAGVAKGFQTGGYDKDLTKALSALFGITPRIATTLGHPPSTTGTTAPPADPVPEAAPAASGGRAGSTSASPERAPRTRTARPPSDPADGTDPGDAAAPDALSGMDLIERELGGRVIEETGQP
jgi:DNA polymerase III subunit gamma/tau